MLWDKRWSCVWVCVQSTSWFGQYTGRSELGNAFWHKILDKMKLAITEILDKTGFSSVQRALLFWKECELIWTQEHLIFLQQKGSNSMLFTAQGKSPRPRWDRELRMNIPGNETCYTYFTLNGKRKIGLTLWLSSATNMVLAYVYRTQLCSNQIYHINVLLMRCKTNMVS